jgi:hypothetical protein
MKYLILLALLAVASPASAQTHAFLSGEKAAVDTKTCFYKANGHVYTLLIGRSRPCPLSIRIPEPLPRPRPGPA